MLNNSAIAGSFALIGMLVLVTLHVKKEILSAADDSRSEQLSREINAGILFLMLDFVLIVIFKISESLI